jgi:hypothetical protein
MLILALLKPVRSTKLTNVTAGSGSQAISFYPATAEELQQVMRPLSQTIYSTSYDILEKLNLNMRISLVSVSGQDCSN